MRDIAPSLINKLDNKEQTIYNDANPKMSIQISRAKTTVMDDSYWITETIREKEGLGDLSLASRRQKAYGNPNRIYNIYVDNGTVKTATREYPDFVKEGWKDKFNLGIGSAVAIAFDGYWELYRKKWQLITDENPNLFWVDNTGKLQTQVWDNETTKLELATEVTKVKAIRAWKNVNIATQDQGLVAGYIKTDGKVYYRNYCQQADGTAIWENEQQITEFVGTAINLNMFIANDYRMGFIIEDALGKIHWIITERNWAGMGIIPEKIDVKIGKLEASIYKVKYKQYREDEYISVNSNILADFLYADSFNEFTRIENVVDELGDYGRFVEFDTRHELFELNTLDFNLSDDNSTNFSCMNIYKLSKRSYLAEFTNFNNGKNELIIETNGLYAKNEAGYMFSAFSNSFTPTGLVPTEQLAPEVEAVWNE